MNVALPKYFNIYNKYLIGLYVFGWWVWLRGPCTGGGGGGGYDPFFGVSLKKITERISSEGAYARFFLCVLAKKIGGGGGVYTQIFGVYSKNITASVGGGIMPNYLCVLGRGGYTQIFGV